jgi:hypothetical protein
MAKRIIEIEAKVAEAAKDLQQITDNIEAAKEETILFQQELSRLERELAKTPKGQLGKQKALRDSLDQVKKRISENKADVAELNLEKGKYGKKLQETKKELNETEKAQSDYNKELEKATGFTRLMDKLTFGMFSQFKSGITILRANIKALGLFRVALISTGIGAIVVALGSFVTLLTQTERGQNALTKATNRLVTAFAGVKQFFVDIADPIQKFGSAIVKFFGRDGKGALEDFKAGLNGVKKAAIDAKDAVQEGFDVGGRAAQLRIDAEKEERKLIVDRQKADTRVAVLRQKSYDEENFSVDQRIAFLQEAFALENSIAEREVANAQRLLDAKKLENTIGEQSNADLNEQAELEANLEKLRAQSARRQTEVVSQIQTRRREALRERQEEMDGFEEQREAITSVFAVRKEKEDQEKEEEAANKEEEHQKGLMMMQREANARAEKVEQERELEKNKNKFIGQGVMATSQLIATVAGRDSKVGKAAATAQAVISGIGAVQNAFKTAQDSPVTKFFPPYPFIQAGIAAAFTAKQVQAINAVDPTGRSGSRGITSRGAGAPAINVVGSSPINQLAETIGQREDTPIKAFVVSDEITDQQALDRKINDNASIG